MNCSTYDDLRRVVANLTNGNDRLSILEAGCGSYSYLPFSDSARITGIDISEKQLARNELIHEKILGDLQTYDLPRQQFDAVICWDVLEHLPRPEQAMENMISATAENGSLIVAIPNVLSTKGLVAKFTPHWFHVFVYRHLLGKKDAGREDNAPFPTFLRFSIVPARLKKMAERKGLVVEYFRLYESPMQSGIRARRKLIDFGMRAVRAVGKALTFGSVDLMLSDCVMVLRRPASMPALAPSRVPITRRVAAVGQVHLGP